MYNKQGTPGLEGVHKTMTKTNKVATQTTIPPTVIELKFGKRN